MACFHDAVWDEDIDEMREMREKERRRGFDVFEKEEAADAD